MATTYQLTAEHMVQKYGAADALKHAKSMAARGLRENREFWGYVAACITKITKEAT